jgi:ADP-ribosylglycohydrolase
MASAPSAYERDRAVACFKALAIGDALAKQTETLCFSDVRIWYPEGVRGFEGTPGDVIPRYRGKHYEWRIGETTDDTEQTLAVARAASKGNAISHTTVGEELLLCTKSIHPGVALWDFLQAGNPARIAAEGDGCGAAMRASPVGVIDRFAHMGRIICDTYECSIPTHGGQSAICAAAAVAAAVSASLEGCSPAEVLAGALGAARTAELLRPSTRPRTIAASLATMHADLSNHRPITPEYIAEHYFPVTPETKVPLAISLALLTESAESTALIAANVGGDADSVASIGSAIAGALKPDTVNNEWFEIVSAVNNDDLVAAALSLAALRK